jgi:hypothetical protein
MTSKQAIQLQKDWGQHLTEEDYHETLYVSIKGVGAKTFKSCSYHEQDDYIFIWTRDESFLIDRKELGDFVIVSNTYSTIVSSEK